MPYSTDQPVRRSFTVSDLSGLVAPDSLPTALVRKNGSTLGGTTVTVTNNSTGDYTASFTMPTAVAGDTFELVVTAVVGGLTQKYTVAIESVSGNVIPNPYIRRS